MLSSSLAAGMKANVDEFALYKELNCSLDYYIANHEPEVAINRPVNENTDFNNAQVSLNNYITGSKDIYFTR